MALACGVDDALDAAPTQCLGQARNVEQLALDGMHTGATVLGVVAVVDDDVFTGGDKLVDEMASHKSAAAGYQSGHDYTAPVADAPTPTGGSARSATSETMSVNKS